MSTPPHTKISAINRELQVCCLADVGVEAQAMSFPNPGSTGDETHQSVGGGADGWGRSPSWRIGPGPGAPDGRLGGHALAGNTGQKHHREAAPIPVY